MLKFSFETACVTIFQIRCVFGTPGVISNFLPLKGKHRLEGRCRQLAVRFVRPYDKNSLKSAIGPKEKEKEIWSYSSNLRFPVVVYERGFYAFVFVAPGRSNPAFEA